MHGEDTETCGFDSANGPWQGCPGSVHEHPSLSWKRLMNRGQRADSCGLHARQILISITVTLEHTHTHTHESLTLKFSYMYIYMHMYTYLDILSLCV